MCDSVCAVCCVVVAVVSRRRVRALARHRAPHPKEKKNTLMLTEIVLVKYNVRRHCGGELRRESDTRFE